MSVQWEYHSLEDKAQLDYAIQERQDKLWREQNKWLVRLYDFTICGGVLLIWWAAFRVGYMLYALYGAGK